MYRLPGRKPAAVRADVAKLSRLAAVTRLLVAHARWRYAKLIDTYGGSRANFTQVPVHTVRTPTGGFQWARGRGSWRSGFFPGVLWYLHALTGDATFGRSAASFTEALSPKDVWWQHTHDVGFIFGCSYGNGLRFGTGVGLNFTLYSSELEAAAALMDTKTQRRSSSPYSRATHSTSPQSCMFDASSAWDDGCRVRLPGCRGQGSRTRMMSHHSPMASRS